MYRQMRCWLPPQGGTFPSDGSPWLFLTAPEGICIFGVTTVTEDNFPVVSMLSGIGKTETKTILSVTAERKTDTCHSCVTGSSLLSTRQNTKALPWVDGFCHACHGFLQGSLLHDAPGGFFFQTDHSFGCVSDADGFGVLS